MIRSATPSTFAAVLAGSAPGDTIAFGPGTYVVNAGSSWPVNRIYLFSPGAFLRPSTGNVDLTLSGGTQTEIAGADISGVRLVLSKTIGMNLHDCIWHDQGASDCIMPNGDSASIVAHNTFRAINHSFCVQGYPSNGNQYTYNRFDNIIEAIHLVSTADNTQIVGNVITNLSRHGIECQSGMTHLTISNNYIGPVGVGGDPGICISCATGGNGDKTKGPIGAGAGQHIYIRNNVLLASAKGQGTGVEVMGSLDVHVDNNLMLGFTSGTWPAGGILNGTGGVQGQGLNTSGNIIQATWLYSDGDNTPWPVPVRTSIGDQTAPPFPPVPPVPAIGLGAVVVVPAADLGLSATSTSSSITWKFTAAADAGTLAIVVKGNGKPFLTLPVAKGDMLALMPGGTPNYEYTAILTIAGKSQSLTAQCLAKDTDAKSANGTPATPAPVPVVDAAKVAAAQATFDQLTAQLAAAAKALADAKAGR